MYIPGKCSELILTIYNSLGKQILRKLFTEQDLTNHFNFILNKENGWVTDNPSGLYIINSDLYYNQYQNPISAKKVILYIH